MRASTDRFLPMTPAPAHAGTGAQRERRRRRRELPRARAPPPSRAHQDAGLAVALGEAPLLARVWPQRDCGAEQEHDAGEPDQVDERLHEHLEVDRAARVDLVGDHEEILGARPVGADSDLARRGLLGEVPVAPGAEDTEPLSAARDVEDRAQLYRVCAAVLRETAVGEVIAPYAHGLAGLELALDRPPVGARAGDADREQDDRR